MGESPEVSVPLSEYTRQVAREAAQLVIDEHVKTCKVKQDVAQIEKNVEDNRKRITKVEISLAKLIGMLVGAATIGGGSGAAVAKLIGG